MRTIPTLTRSAALAAAILAACGHARATEHIVSSSGQLSIALASAVTGDIITILPSGSPYTQFPGFAFSEKRLTVRGSTGNAADVVLDGAALDRVLMISGAGADGSVIRDVTIQNGRGPATANASGAGIHISNADVAIESCIIRNNHVPATDGNGAGLYATGVSILTVRGTVFEGNTLGAGGDGAGVHLVSCPTAFVDCHFLDNIAEATLTNEDSLGGGAYIDGVGNTTFSRCTFAGNKAEFGGGLLVSVSATVTVDACRLEGNTARYGAGLALTSIAGTASIRNSLIVGNTALVNDCAIRADRPLTVVNCTITGNTATGNYIIGSAAADRRVVVVDNSVIWGNTASGGISPITTTNAPIIRRCLVQTAYTVANGSGFNTVANPMFANAGAGDYRPLAGSPAIDAGDTLLYFGSLADYDGNPRGVDFASAPNTGVAPFGPVIDIGAFEAQNQVSSACYANCDQSTTPPVLNVADFGCFLTKYAAGCP
ncbi:MAG: right-handed parallel beta-helix repeat-containing protein [Phycisphaerales bacterium]